MNDPIVHHHYHFGAGPSTPSPSSSQGPEARVTQTGPGRGEGRRYRSEFERGSFEIMQQAGPNQDWHACAWVWSPYNQYSAETWVWVTNNPNDPDSVYLVPGGGGSPNNLTWRISKAPGPYHMTEQAFLDWVRTRCPGATLVGTHHTTVTQFWP